MIRTWVVISRHNLDDFPLSIHDTRAKAMRAARRNHRARGDISKVAFPNEILPTWDISGYVHTAVVEFGMNGKPVKCDLVGEEKKKAAKEASG